MCGFFVIILAPVTDIIIFIVIQKAQSIKVSLQYVPCAKLHYNGNDIMSQDIGFFKIKPNNNNNNK